MFKQLNKINCLTGGGGSLPKPVPAGEFPARLCHGDDGALSFEGYDGATERPSSNPLRAV
jgi:hypothetical protein